MLVIKRYPNRKLYDTEAKEYITLGGIAQLIRQGQEIQVVDYASGEDLTAVTLTQIIFEQEKKQGGFLPQAVLTGLVQAGGNRLSTLRRALDSPLDLARHVDEEIEHRVQALISRGELAAEEGLRLRDELLRLSPWQSEPLQPTEEALERALDERGVPTQEDLQKLAKQLETLAVKLDKALSDSE
jgi:polyhydroxyalkanoate synthesis repressor PhaR